MPFLPWGIVCLPGFSKNPVESGTPTTSLIRRVPAYAQRGSISRCRRFLVLLFLVLCLSSFGAPALADGTAYYINNQMGSNCSDGGSHNMAQPWCTFASANRIRTFAPGDQILLARGGSWNQELSLAGHGTTNAPITLGAYGTAANPKILRNQAISDICVLLTDASYWRISDLEVGASVGILLHLRSCSTTGLRSVTSTLTTTRESGAATRQSIRCIAGCWILSYPA